MVVASDNRELKALMVTVDGFILATSKTTQ